MPRRRHHRWTGCCEQDGVEIDIHQLRHAHATELINNGASVEADAVLGLTPASFGGYATDEAALASEPFDAPRPLVRIFAVDLVQELVGTGRA